MAEGKSLELIEKEAEQEIVLNLPRCRPGGSTGHSKGGQVQVYVNKAEVVSHGPIRINNIYHGTSKSKKTKSKQPSKPLTTSREKPSQNDIEYLCQELGRRWRQLGRALGFSDGQLDNFEEDYRGNSKERNYQMLKNWKDRPAVSKAVLAQALAGCGLGNLADYLSQEQACKET